jgi:hypothetical protein
MIQQKAFLIGLQYRIVYKKGTMNRAANVLSRRPKQTSAFSMSVAMPGWVETVIEGYQQDDRAKQLLTELSIIGFNDQGYSLQDGIIRFKGRVWLGYNTDEHAVVMLALHSSGLGGHSGVLVTYHRIKETFGQICFFSKRGVPASASIDAYVFLLKLFKHPHYYSSRIRESRYMNHPSKDTA